jgi:hypothetical protein
MMDIFGVVLVMWMPPPFGNKATKSAILGEPDADSY